MATRKRNEWLEADESEDEADYNSENEIKGRSTVTGRAAKRRKTDSNSGADLSDDPSEVFGGVPVDEGEDDIDEDKAEHNSNDIELQRLLKLKRALPDSRFNVAAFDDDDASDEDAAKPGSQPIELPKVSRKSAEAAQRAARRTGILYLSRIPPFMKPSTLRSLLTPYGALNRIFLTPESAQAHSSRVRAGGNKKKSYTDGWVEFVNKREAKDCAAMLNGQNVGGKGWYRDDVWVMKYLHKYKWSDLTESLAAENAERANRMRAEIARSTREQKSFIDSVERGKMLENMEAKRKGRRNEGEDEGEEEVDGRFDMAKLDAENVHKPRRERKSVFRQNVVREKAAKSRPTEQPDEVKRVLSKIF